ncbi:MAG: flagellar basal body P-ring formation chaperone FlgA [Rickettsiales bacterium]|nr:flagellar basal body P-ring formation chaperone FlgA [Rickettsiales bacterium]
MKQLMIIMLGLAIGFIIPAIAFASNPWAEHYAKKAEPLPVALPAVADAISTARQQTGIESSITFKEAEKAIAKALKKEGAGETLKVKIIDHSRQKALLTHRAPITFEISDVDYNARELVWSATLYPYESERPLSPIKLEGQYDEVVEVPVLTRRVRRDEIITLADIKWHTVEASRLRADTALQAEQIVGQAPLRTISPNRSVRLAELARPSVVKKSDQVTLQFKNAAMEIKTLGEAMEDGAAGDIIRIRNKDSHQPVHARIIAAGLAEAMPLGVLAQAGGNY